MSFSVIAMRIKAPTQSEASESDGNLCGIPLNFLKLQDAQPPLTPRRGLDYRGRVPDASP